MKNFKDNFYILILLTFMTIIVGFIYFALSKAAYELPTTIKNSTVYMKLFDEEKYNQIEKNKAETKLRISKLKREECMIFLQAKKDMAKFKTERYILKGYEEKKAKKIIERDIKEQELDCID